MKKALLTTTALVALNSAAFASSIDTPVNSASSTHHTHSAATIVWSGDANIKYNVPLKAGTEISVHYDFIYIFIERLLTINIAFIN